MKIDRSIFRAYDIRGIVGSGLTEETIYALGRAIGSMVIEHGEKQIVMGRDGRLSGPILSQALSDGLLASGCDVLDIGLVPTPLLYYATYMMESHSGVMLTGSHNPAEYNGLKIMIGGKTLAENDIQALYERILNNDFTEGQGEKSDLEMTERYISRVTRDIPLARPLKIVVDCGNGAGGFVAPELFRRMGCEVHELFCEIDGNFPNHHPDPSQTENLQELIRLVRETKADIGLAFDGDADRLGVVTHSGEVIWPDRQLMVFAKEILSRRPGAKIIYDVKCTSHLANVISAAGGVPIMWKTGHSLVKAKLAETQAVLAGEMSGHIFFKDRWYGFDDAIYSGARMLEILAKTAGNSDDLFKDIPNSVNTPELKIYVEEHEKFSLMNQLIQSANFSTAEVVTIDGLRVNFQDGWGLVRLSNTTPCLVLRFEAESEKILKKIQDVFRDFLLAAKADLVLPF
ncbi:MAG TPA: phosphomannomutase/phosphoglucomutase [Gammaproteobacteria bacterium]|nr:phosphomannomutase/phosphoglucomutase [Gammaproteobacteria bacterium]